MAGVLVRVNGVVEGEAQAEDTLAEVVAQFAGDLGPVQVRLNGQVVSRDIYRAKVCQLQVTEIDIESIR